MDKKALAAFCAVFFLLNSLFSARIGHSQALRLEEAGTERVYFTYRDRPLLSFGGLSDFIFYGAPDAYDYEQWADWAADHGMNHVRAYPPMSWKYVEAFAEENGGAVENVLFPYEETEPGSRQFDLTRFDEAYWDHFRRQMEDLASRGIIIHLLMVNGWQITSTDANNWESHFFNPANNVNAATEHLEGDPLRFYRSVADGEEELVELQKAWLRKLVEETADLGNVYYDLVHEIAPSDNDWLAEEAGWEGAQQWIEEMAQTVRGAYEEHPGVRGPVLLGFDAGPVTARQRQWIFSRPYFDLLIYGKAHTAEHARDWLRKYKKPYIPQESWDDNEEKWSYRVPTHRVHLRKYFWKFMMQRVQQLDMYVKRRTPQQSMDIVNPPGYDHNYNPNGWSAFEDDALVLRRFWNRLADYPNLAFRGVVAEGPGTHRYVLSSSEEAVIYLSSATGDRGVRFGEERLWVRDLALEDGTYRLNVVRPDGGVADSQEASVEDGELELRLPAFTDDLAVHVYEVE